MKTRLQFGIPSFDALFDREEPAGDEDQIREYSAYGIRLAPEDPKTKIRPTTSLCFIGPDGTGKSVFGLHLAAQYMADLETTKEWLPRVLYVSTDLKYGVANGMWEKFGLDKPNQREFPFAEGYRKGEEPTRDIELAPLNPTDIERAVLDPEFLPAKVHFVDLVSRTMGDDWSFINRLLAVLKTPKRGQAPHLLIIDAVEGFETLVGEKDAFGETTSRRARIAQVMRTAGEKCHVCFIVEEPRNEERFPEEFVTDVVVRLRNSIVRGYSRRTLEVRKARGQSHVRGQHPFVIRGGNGSTTGAQQNADDPTVKNCYIHVYPSLHSLSREEMKLKGHSNPEPRNDRVAAFGIQYLDEMLARLPADPSGGLDDQGLPIQTTTALIGEVATQKTSLANAFLARSFRGYIFQTLDIFRELNRSRDGNLMWQAFVNRLLFANRIRGLPTKPSHPKVQILMAQAETLVTKSKNKDSTGVQLDLHTLLGHELASLESIDLTTNPGMLKFAAWLAAALEDSGAAVLITTSDQDRDKIVVELERRLENSRIKALQDWPTFQNRIPEELVSSHLLREIVKEHLQTRTICRRLELHDLSSPILFQIVQRSLQKAQQEIFMSDDLPKATFGITIEDRLPSSRLCRHSGSWNIRVVVDDLSTLKDTYPDIGADPLFLPFLLSFFRLEGVTSLIIDSQTGRPDAQVGDSLSRELRALVPHKLLTWQVPFYGEMRDAITVVPPFPGGLPSLIREVRWEPNDGHSKLVVDPELELYSGLNLTQGEPQPVPLEVRLFEETEALKDYIREVNSVFDELFTPLKGHDQVAISGLASDKYDALRDSCNLQTDTLLNHTLVFQIDEFWAINRSHSADPLRSPRGPITRRGGALCPLGHYLTELTSIRVSAKELVRDRIADPFGLFQGPPAVEPPTNDKPLHAGPWQRRHYFSRSSQGIDDRSDATVVECVDRVPYSWDFGFLLCPPSMWELAANRPIGLGEKTVADIWQIMPSVKRPKPMGYVRWREFLGACKAVAQVQSERSTVPVRILDLSIITGESLSCLILEIWASEIMDSLTEPDRTTFFGSLNHISWTDPSEKGILEWVGDRNYRLAFYKSWLLLLDVITLSDLVDRQTIPKLKTRPDSGVAVATRHWYKTACGSQKCAATNEFSLPVRMPGHFSVRGDWFLAVAGGSRSERLARRVLDLLNTRRANFRRMELGIGLPTRDIATGSMVNRLPTALIKLDEQNRPSAVSYGELTGQGVRRDTETFDKENFGWLWRSQLRDYHRHNRIWRQWIGQMIVRWDDIRNESRADWLNGFDLYDQLNGLSTPEAETCLSDKELKRELNSWGEFNQMCDFLEKQLKVATNVQLA